MPVLESAADRYPATSGGLVLELHAEMSSGNKAKETKRCMMKNPKLSSEGRTFAAYHQIKLEKSMNSGARRAQEPIRSDGDN